MARSTVATLAARTWDAREIARARFLPRVPLKPIRMPLQPAGTGEDRR